MSDTLTFTAMVSAPPKIVYHAFTNETVLRQWLCDATQVIAREGAPYFLRWDTGYYAAGEFETLKPYEMIALSWRGRDDPARTHVQVTLAPEAAGTRIHVQHSGLGDGDTWEAVRWQIKYGWENSLETLNHLLDTGLDLRLVRRPMLGISIGEFDAETASRLGAPVTDGVRITGAVEGMGAHTAGLQADDVLVNIGGRPVGDWTSLTNVLNHHSGGDTVEVVFYRGGQQHMVNMTLSKRPQPEVPHTLAELAETLQFIHAELDAELDRLVAGVPEACLGRRPEPEEWSANEVLAHLIWTERYMQMWLWQMVNNDETLRWTENNYTHIAGILALHPTSDLLVAEFKRAEAEKVAAVLAIPPSFTDYKGTFTRLATDFVELKDHTRQHFEQMRRAVDAARQAEAAR